MLKNALFYELSFEDRLIPKCLSTQFDRRFAKKSARRSHHADHLIYNFIPVLSTPQVIGINQIYWSFLNGIRKAPSSVQNPVLYMDN